MQNSQDRIIKKSFFIFVAFLFFLIAFDLYHIANGTGELFGIFSLKWGAIFAFTLIFLVILLFILWLFLWRAEKLQGFIKGIISVRQRVSFLRWIFAIILLIFPIYFFQYTLWGLVFRPIYFRLFLWGFLSIILAILFTREDEKLIGWFPLLQSILLTSTSYTLAYVFSDVKNYPFNLYWSDGNRLWDYSLIFGRQLYNYPIDQEIPSLTSRGRQLLWGLPFLLPNTSILLHRFWSALLFSFPYMVLGWFSFKVEENRRREWLLLGLWAFLFLNQGPIYTPLVLSAILVAIAWERPLWIAIPLVALAGYYAESARWTWAYAPAIWAGMMSLNGSKLKGARPALRDWGRAIALAIAGVALWYLLPIIQSVWTGVSILPEERIAYDQPLLWYRLLPNDTYREGIVGGLLIAILPLIILLSYLLYKKHWQASLWQKLSILGSLLAFLIVGLIISTKIGGGNNLHNLDMLLIALLFVSAIAWKNGGSQWFRQSNKAPLWIKITLILLFTLPAYASMRKISPNLALNTEEVLLVEFLTDHNALADPPIKSLPSDEEVQRTLDIISAFSEISDKKGDVLFIDLRQLLTFGYVPKIRLVPEYEKKRLMNEAMASNADYFAPYYQDLADHRFSLIITEPLKVVPKYEEGAFAEEGDAWMKWVSAPTLCFYHPIEIFRSVHVQLLAPRQEPLDCSAYLE